jgi:hypothetical protein
MEDDFSHLGQDEREARERAEVLLNDGFDLVLFLFQAKLLRITLAGVMFDAILAWATEAAEPRHRLQERWTALATLSDEASLLKNLAERDVQVRTDLRNAVEAITTAARQLSSVSPDDHQGLSVAMQAFNQAVWQLHRLSGDELRLAADRVNAVSTERVAVGEPYVRDVRRVRFSEELDRLSSRMPREQRQNPWAPQEGQRGSCSAMTSLTRTSDRLPCPTHIYGGERTRRITRPELTRGIGDGRSDVRARACFLDRGWVWVQGGGAVEAGHEPAIRGHRRRVGAAGAAAASDDAPAGWALAGSPPGP